MAVSLLPAAPLVFFSTTARARIVPADLDAFALGRGRPRRLVIAAVAQDHALRLLLDLNLFHCGFPGHFDRGSLWGQTSTT